MIDALFLIIKVLDLSAKEPKEAFVDKVTILIFLKIPKVTIPQVRIFFGLDEELFNFTADSNLWGSIRCARFADSLLRCWK